MPKNVPKKPILAFLVVAAVLVGLLILITLLFPVKTKYKTNPTGTEAISVVGPITELDSKKKIIKVLNTRNQKTFSFQIDASTPVFKNNVEVPFERMQKDELVGVYSNEGFDDAGVNKGFGYLIILSTEKSKTVPKVTSDGADYQPGDPNSEGK